MRNTLLIFRLENDCACTFALLQSLLIAAKHLINRLCLLIATCLSLLLHLRDAAIDSLQILNLKLQVDNLLVAHWINATIHMHNIIVVKTTQHMQDCICLTNVCQEFVAQSLALAGTFYLTGDIHNLHSGRNHALRMLNLR